MPTGKPVGMSFFMPLAFMQLPGKPEHVSVAAAFLGSPQASWRTGEVLDPTATHNSSATPTFMNTHPKVMGR
jgi:NAD(P)-dependent dehydrogenase (short-subunit alcohol dehydrogenase family)